MRPCPPRPSPDLPQLPPAARTIFNYGTVLSNGTNIEVINNGHTIQLEFPGSYFTPEVTVAMPTTAGGGPPTHAPTRSCPGVASSPNLPPTSLLPLLPCY